MITKINQDGVTCVIKISQDISWCVVGVKGAYRCLFTVLKTISAGSAALRGSAQIFI